MCMRFELNGMRNHEENRGVLKLAAEWRQVLISGGDRHGCEPNAWLNLTNAADFREFVEEIREGTAEHGGGDAAIFAVPLGWRFYQNFTHVIADYPEHPEGRRHWDERTYHPGRERRNCADDPTLEGWGAGVPEDDLWRGDTGHARAPAWDAG
jgi:hypothetical protein